MLTNKHILESLKPAELSDQDKKTTATDTRILKLMELAGIPGLAMAEVSPDHPAHLVRTLGIADVESKKPVTPTTMFEAASLSKTVFSYLVLKLVEQGRLNLDTPLYEILPYDRFDSSNAEWARKLTARIILSHQSGLLNWQREPKILKFDFEPGTKFGYSGEGFFYLQKVVEHITGLTLEDLAQREVFEPLGMRNSHYALSNNVVVGHNEACQPRPRSAQINANAAASLHTTASDYAKFLDALLNAGDLSAASIQMIFTPPPIHVTDTISWGLGWGLQRTGQDITAFHWGDNGMCKAFVAINLKEKKAVVYFANSANGLAIINEVVSPTVGDVSV